MADGNGSDAGIRKAALLGVDLLGSGFGAVAGLVAGGPIGAAIGAMAGTGIAAAGRDVVSRLLSQRQEARVGAVLLQAGARITATELQGRSIRDDGFWEGDHSAGYEFAEGVILAAMDTYEERKIPYMGNLLASVAFETDIDPATANLAVRLAESASWLDLQLLGVFANPERFPMPTEELRKPGSWSEWTTKNAFTVMSSMDDGFLTYSRNKTEPFGLAKWDLHLSSVSANNRGTLLISLMDLAAIPDPELRPVYEDLLTGEPDDE